MQKLLPAIRSAAAYAPSEAVDGESPPLFPAFPLNRPLRVPRALRIILCQIYGSPFSEQSHDQLPFVMAQLTILHNMDII